MLRLCGFLYVNSISILLPVPTSTSTSNHQREVYLPKLTILELANLRTLITILGITRGQNVRVRTDGQFADQKIRIYPRRV